MKKLTALLLAMGMAVSFAACGGSTSSSSEAVSSEAASSEAASSQATSETPTLDAIKAKGVLTMMTSTGFPPFEYLGESGQPAGVDIDIAQMVADALGVKLEVMDMDFALLVESLKSGKGDMVAAGMTVTDERLAQIDFTVTYATAGQVVLLPLNSELTGMADLAGKTVAVQESTTGHIYVDEQNAENNMGIKVMAFKNAIECAGAVANGRADAAVIDSVPAISLVQTYSDSVTMLDEMITAEDFAIGIAKNKEDLLAFVNEVINEAIASGKIEELLTMHDEIVAEG